MVLNFRQLPLIYIGFVVSALVVGGLLSAGVELPLPTKSSLNHAPATYGTAADTTATIPAHSPSAPLRRAALTGPYTVEILKVVDGDTFEARVRVWFGQEITTLVRIRGIDAPELHARCPQELQGAQTARTELEAFLRSGTIILSDVGLDKYAGRVLASVQIAHPSAQTDDVATHMLTSGLARPYAGGRRQTWCNS